jgi:hypothetical protein
VESKIEKKTRRKWFMIFSGICIAAWTAGIFGYVDGAVASYILVQAFSLSICSMSLYWVMSVGTRSSVFRWLILISAGISIANAGQLYARYLWLMGDLHRYDSFLSSVFWHYRQVPETLAMAYLLSIVVSRMFGGDGGRNGYATD